MGTKAEELSDSWDWHNVSLAIVSSRVIHACCITVRNRPLPVTHCHSCMALHRTLHQRRASQSLYQNLQMQCPCFGRKTYAPVRARRPESDAVPLCWSKRVRIALRTRHPCRESGLVPSKGSFCRMAPSFVGVVCRMGRRETKGGHGKSKETIGLQ